MCNKINFLVTGCGGDIGQSIGKILSKYDKTKNLYGLDISNKNAGKFIYKNFFTGLECNHVDYLKNLELFIEKKSIDVLIPMSEPELRFLSKKNILCSMGNSRILTASKLALETGFDKFETIKFLKKNKLPFLKTFMANEHNFDISFPLILKSRKGSGSKDINIINNSEELRFYSKDYHSDYIIQEYIDDKEGEFTCGLFRSRNNNIRSIILKRELNNGYSGYGEVVHNDVITDFLKKIAVKLNLIGSINIQLRVKNNVPYVFEINPRFSSTVFFRHLFGFKDLIWSIEDLMEYPLSKNISIPSGRKFYKGFQEYID